MKPLLARARAFTLLFGIAQVGTAQAPQQPSFTEHFEGSVLDSANWIVSNRKGGGSGQKGGFSAEYVKVAPGLLTLTATQVNGPSGLIQTGSEIQSRQTFGYGTYVFVMRLASTSPTPDGDGRAVSGTVSSAFTYINHSETEIDIEFLGDDPNRIHLTNWINSKAPSPPTLSQTDAVSLSNLAGGFHEYKFVWLPDSVEWFIDGKSVAKHRKNVPTAPAYIMISNKATDRSVWGGAATPDRARYMYVRNVDFTPYEEAQGK